MLVGVEFRQDYSQDSEEDEVSKHPRDNLSTCICSRTRSSDNPPEQCARQNAKVQYSNIPRFGERTGWTMLTLLQVWPRSPHPRCFQAVDLCRWIIENNAQPIIRPNREVFHTARPIAHNNTYELRVAIPIDMATRPLIDAIHVCLGSKLRLHRPATHLHRRDTSTPLH
jgi:hypothetical protein